MDSQTSASSQASPSPHTFQVDLRGLVDLLSHHLYSSPRVYLRELLQNAVDAITARRAEEPGAPARVRLFASGGELRVEDSGVGLTESDLHTLLATIGRSSKRADGLQEARSDFLGQFGIGLLACFVVAERIRVVSRSSRTPGAPPVEWTARDDGSYTVRTLPHEERPEPGTTVHLVARAGAAEWLTEQRVLQLARDFGSLLPYDVKVGEEPVTDLAGALGPAVRLSREPAGGAGPALSRAVRVHPVGLGGAERSAGGDPWRGVRARRPRSVRRSGRVTACI